VATRACLTEVASFAITMLIVGMAFALGLHSVLKHSRESCDEGGNAVERTCNDTFVLHHREIGLFCKASVEGSERRPCPEDCWLAFARDPANASHWSPVCGDLKPALEAGKGDGTPLARSGGLFPDLGDEHNRFRHFVGTAAVLFWSIFDPGHPEVVGCTEGAARAAGLILWACYNIVIVIVLLNVRRIGRQPSKNDVLLSLAAHRSDERGRGRRCGRPKHLLEVSSHGAVDGFLQQGRSLAAALQPGLLPRGLHNGRRHAVSKR